MAAAGKWQNKPTGPGAFHPISTGILSYATYFAHRRVLASIGPYDPAKPKNAATQVNADVYSNGSLHTGSSEAQIRESAAMTMAA